MNNLFQKYKIQLSLVTLVLMSFLFPVLEFVRTNPNFDKMYGFGPTEYFQVILFFFLVPVILLVGFSWVLRSDKAVKVILGIAALPFILGLALPLEGIGKLVVVAVGLVLLVLALRKLDTLLWMLSVLLVFSVFQSFRSLYKIQSDRFLFDTVPVSKPKLALNPATKNIIIILLDGSDLTTSYLDQAGLPREDIFPNLHHTFKADFDWFTNAYANAPQTHMSVPSILTGISGYASALKNMKSGNDLISWLKDDFQFYGFLYKKHYEGLWPSEMTRTSDTESAMYILFKVWLYKVSLGQTSLPFDVGTDFEPERENYDFDSFISAIQTSSKPSVFYTHMFRRSLKNMLIFDEEFGKLISTLKTQNTYEHSVIALISDHGLDYTQTAEIYGERARPTDRVFRVPLAIKRLGLNQGKIHSEVVQNIDFVPSLLSALSTSEVGSKFEGMNLLSGTILPREVILNCDIFGKKWKGDKLNRKCVNE